MNIQALDTKIFYLINNLPHPPVLNFIALWIHLLTRGGIIYYPFILFALFSKNEKIRHFGKLSAFTLISVYVFVDIILKHIFARLRPYEALQHVFYITPAPHNFSFPSGEAAAAAALSTCCWIMYPKSKLSYSSLVGAIIIFIDRIYMGHHYPSDVLAGIFIGTITAFGIYKLFLTNKVKKSNVRVN